MRAKPNRRHFLISSIAAGGGAVLGSTAMQGFIARAVLGAEEKTPLRRRAAQDNSGYGRLLPAGPELALPAGFTYRLIGIEDSMMSDGYLTPKAHDGMAAFPLPNGNIRLIRNHEDADNPTSSRVKGNGSFAYDPRGGGGTTSLEVDPETRQLVRSFVSLNGTFRNCAGGPTPWGSWISCEETTQGRRAGWRRPHGYCFEVSAAAEGPVNAVPLIDMGRFAHEAAAVDPNTGMVYETEDRNQAGFYRFIPNEPGRLAGGGRLQMLAIENQPNLEMSRGQQTGMPLPVIWVDISQPDPGEAERNPSAVAQQGFAQGAASFSRLEGVWYGDGGLFFNSTDGGDAGLGQVWRYQPQADSGGELMLLFESRSPQMLRRPDNITVSPRGGILLCEDNNDAHLRGLTPTGQIFDFAHNLINNREFAGATWSLDGQTLFVNIQGDTRVNGPGNKGMTFAIWGPWEDGAL